MNLKQFFIPFPETDIEWRIQQTGLKQDGQTPWALVLAYITNRAIMQRLDDVCGQAYWKNEFNQAPNGGVLCGISILVCDNWITKWDGADNTKYEPIKGGLSNSMKRAAVQWGIGRYLYSLPVMYAQNVNSKKYEGSIYQSANKEKHIPAFFWSAPKLPIWALPKNENNNQQNNDEISEMKILLNQIENIKLQKRLSDDAIKFKMNAAFGKINYSGLTIDELKKLIEIL